MVGFGNSQWGEVVVRSLGRAGTRIILFVLEHSHRQLIVALRNGQVPQKILSEQRLLALHGRCHGYAQPLYSDSSGNYGYA